MNRKKIYVFGLVGFFVTWGVFGFMAAAPPGEPNLQATIQPVENTPILPAEPEPVGIPATGEPEPVWTEILGFYGMIGLAALFLILALLSYANQSTAPAVKRKGSPSEETQTHEN